ncbi:MAG TPA: VTT domain-containing protein [Pyrinomonadaceae bacterium]|nr:VTT domain-containing protein [Pyrinomonadaceae bacterium]
MKSFIHKITGGLTKLSHYLVLFGPFGLLAIAFLDSLMVPMPGGVDAVLLLLSAARPAWMLIYVAAATIGSTAGCVGLYLISKRAGHRALRRFSEIKQKRVKDLIDRYDVLSVLVASLLPPPFPFKLFVVSAGVFRLNLVRFTIAIAAGRTFRYLLEGYLAAHYGEHAKDILARYYPAIGIGLAVLIIIVFVGKSLLRHARNAEPEPVSDVES